MAFNYRQQSVLSTQAADFQTPQAPPPRRRTPAVKSKAYAHFTDSVSLDAFSVVAVGDWIFDAGALHNSDTQLLQSSNPVFVCRQYEQADEDGNNTVGIIQSLAFANSTVPMELDGSTWALVNVSDEDHQYARPEPGATVLQSAVNGVARIVWKPDPVGEQLCFVLMSNRAGLIDVTLTQTGGSNGTSTSAPSYVYTVTDALTGEELGTNVNPTTAPHTWVRHTGQMTAASSGVAFQNVDGNFELRWINEQTIFEACDQQGLLTVT